MAASGLSGMRAEDIQQQALQPENRGSFTLYRADTHGTEIVIVKDVSEDFAKSVMEKLEAKPHHQGYWYRGAENTP